jgi:excisionase family DNA binding protein
MIKRDTLILNKLSHIERLLEAQADKLMSPEAASEYLDLSKSYLYRLAADGILRGYKPNGRKLYFYQSDLDAFVKGTQETKPHPSPNVKPRKELGI